MLYGFLNCFWGYALKVEAARTEPRPTQGGAFTSMDGALALADFTKRILRLGKLEICGRKIK
jgi:hypothetical protein